MGWGARRYGERIMRATVGPLSPAVYWRRRLMVLGILLLVVLVIAFSCSGGDENLGTPTGAGSGQKVSDPSAGAVQPSPSADSSFLDKPPRAGGPAKPPVSSADPLAGPVVGANVNGSVCTDLEMSVLPVPAAQTAKLGQGLNINLKIKNVSTRTCERDVGADVQEIYIKQGAARVWSSDDCAGAVKAAPDIHRFVPDEEREYFVTWNGHESSQCVSGSPNGPLPEAGDYEVMGRLGDKRSDPIKLTLTN